MDPLSASGGGERFCAISFFPCGRARDTGNLDEQNTGHIFRILQNLAHEQGYCVVIVTHDLQVAEMADRVFRMRDGVLIEEAA